MREALREAERAAASGEVPVGAVVVQGSEVGGRGRNQPITAVDPTAHAEVVALRDAARTLGNYRLTGVRLYVTVEPCMMCVGAMVHARVGTLLFGTREPKAGAVVSSQQALEHSALNHRVEVVEDSGQKKPRCCSASSRRGGSQSERPARLSAGGRKTVVGPHPLRARIATAASRRCTEVSYRGRLESGCRYRQWFRIHLSSLLNS